MAGPKRKSRKVIELEGGVPKHKESPASATILGPADCPRWLPGKAAEAWKNITTEMASLSVICAPDRTTLEMLCMSYAEFHAANDELKSGGLTVPTGTGSIKAHPAVAIRAAALDRIHKICKCLLLTPAARRRLDVGDPDSSEENPFAQYGG